MYGFYNSLGFHSSKRKDSEVFRLSDTFLCDRSTQPSKKPKKTYLFLQDIEVDLKQRIIHTPAIYWASDAAGKKRLSLKQLEDYLDQWDLSPGDLHLQCHLITGRFDGIIYDALREIHDAFGFDPDSDEIAKALELPILEINPSYGRFSEGESGRKYLFLPSRMHEFHSCCRDRGGTSFTFDVRGRPYKCVWIVISNADSVSMVGLQIYDICRRRVTCYSYYLSHLIATFRLRYPCWDGRQKTGRRSITRRAGFAAHREGRECLMKLC